MQVSLVDLEVDSGHDPAKYLTFDEQMRAGRFVRSQDRRWYERSHAALRALLAQRAQCPVDAITYAVDRAGKPRLAGTMLQFNLAHCRGRAAVAIDTADAIGVDIETIRPIEGIDELARECLSAGEHRDFSALPDAERARALLIAWTRKEAVLKAIGTGLQVPPASVGTGVEATDLRLVVERQAVHVTTRVEPDFVVSVASVGGAARPARWTFIRWCDPLGEPAVPTAQTPPAMMA
jgi:4'-phosphopantetheinyl transferase